MLGVEGSGQHMQPMAHHPDETGQSLWFLTRRDSDLVASVGSGAQAHFCVISKAQDFHACLAGRLEEAMDRTRLDAMWNPVTAAWFDGGKDDPRLVMLALRLSDAAIWASTGSSARFAYEIAKANLTDDDPDVGVHNVVRFA